MTTSLNRQWRAARRPVGLAQPSDFQWREEPIGEPGPGQFLVRILYLSLDPSNRTWLWEKQTYLPPLALGDVMGGGGIGRIEKSQHLDFPVGAHVIGLFGWQDYCVHDGSGLTALLPNDPNIPLTMHYGLFGHIGLTAYFGLLDVGKPKAGETLVVSGAAGAVGSLVGEIGKIQGCRVIGIAGSEAKCHWLTKELGFDAAIDYKRESVPEQLSRHCPQGIDIYFDNVGGAMLEPVIDRLNIGGRIVVCGAISQYNKSDVSEFDPGPRNLFRLVTQRARMEGFLVFDYWNRATEAIGAMAQWFQQGKIKYRVDVVEGLENAPRALNKLFDGSNAGKLIVKIA
jgi:NADPH-dependent curcumin reductase